MNKYGIPRGESLFQCELSDFWDLMKIDEDPHPLHYMVMTIFQGEMNSNRTLYGRFYCSVNKILCPVGAIFVYLFIKEVISIYSL